MNTTKEEKVGVKITSILRRDNINSVWEESYLIESEEFTYEFKDFKSAFQAFINRLK